MLTGKEEKRSKKKKKKKGKERKGLIVPNSLRPMLAEA
jgi:hypothetical protein